MGTEDRAPTAAEFREMEGLVQSAMEDGAWGLSSGTFYVPGAYAEPEEIEELAKLVAPFGGAYQSHYRDESTYTVGLIASDVAAGLPRALASLTHAADFDR